MRAEDIHNRIKAQPFRPFRVYTASGAHCDVPHPELILVTSIEVVIATRIGKNNFADETVYVSPAHITHLEMINGQRRPPRSRGNVKRSK